mgnify:CR=1 FL=1
MVKIGERVSQKQRDTLFHFTAISNFIIRFLAFCLKGGVLLSQPYSHHCEFRLMAGRLSLEETSLLGQPLFALAAAIFTPRLALLRWGM